MNENKSIKLNNLEYLFGPDSYLNENEAKYILSELWKIINKNRNIKSDLNISFQAISKNKANDILSAESSIQKSKIFIDKSIKEKHNFFENFFISLPNFNKEKITITMINDNNYSFSFDLPFLAFVLLNRLDENFIKKDKFDIHKRPKTKNLLISRINSIQKPIIDETCNFLRSLLSNEFSNPFAGEDVLFTQDIDHILYGDSFFKKIKGIFSDMRYFLVFPLIPLINLKFLIKWTNNISRDIYCKAILNYSQILRKYGHKGIFFIMLSDKSEYDSGYDVDDSFQKILKKIEADGHEIGLHPSYNTANDDALFLEEVKKYKEIFGHTPVHVRYHYLRSLTSDKWILFEKIGIKYDHSIGFSDSIGYRVGTGMTYTPYNFEAKKPFNVKVVPMTLMDDVLYNKKIKWLNSLKEHINRSKKSNSKISLLFHNGRLMGSKIFANFLFWRIHKFIKND